MGTGYILSLDVLGSYWAKIYDKHNKSAVLLELYYSQHLYASVCGRCRKRGSEPVKPIILGGKKNRQKPFKEKLRGLVVVPCCPKSTRTKLCWEKY